MSSRIAQLASIVSTNALKVNTYLEDNHLPMPSFDVDGPTNLNIQSEDVQNSREAALEAMMELSDLLLGPVACMLPDTAEALERFKDSEPNHTGFALAHNTNETMYGYFGLHPDKADQFAKSMRAFCREEVGWSVDYTVNSYDWGTIPGTLVDVGGSDGHISIALAQAYPTLNFIVQDLPHVTGMAKPQAESLVKAGRISFQSYDFFTVQPAVASAYLYRGIFHNWPDHYVVRILQNLVPALRPGSRVILNETLSPEPGTLPLSLQRRACYMDMLLMSLNNARQRTVQEWQQLFKTADTRFGTVKVFHMPKAALSILEVFWEG